MKTKDVRHLCLCPVCGKLGDERLMLRVGPMECLAHDRCVFSTDNGRRCRGNQSVKEFDRPPQRGLVPMRRHLATPR